MAALVTHIMSVPALLGNSQDVSPVNGAGARDCKIKVIFTIFYVNICFTILSEWTDSRSSSFSHCKVEESPGLLLLLLL